MLTVSLLVCAMMALTAASEEQDISINGTAVDGVNNTAVNCPEGWSQFSGRCFLFVPTQMTWAKAQEHCLTQKAGLASIHSSEEHKYLQDMTTAEHLPTWVGGSDCQEEGAWFWIDSTSKDYTAWCPAQPASTLDQCCIQINTGGGQCWDDVPCSTKNPSICVLK